MLSVTGGTCDAMCYTHPYDPWHSSWKAMACAILFPAFVLGRNEDRFQQLTKGTGKVKKCASCGQDRTQRGVWDASCACASMLTCLWPILWSLTHSQRQRLIDTFSIDDTSSGATACCLASCCMPCSLVQMANFLDERKHERCASAPFRTSPTGRLHQLSLPARSASPSSALTILVTFANVQPVLSSESPAGGRLAS
jgi:hypothetical protein